MQCKLFVILHLVVYMYTFSNVDIKCTVDVGDLRGIANRFECVKKVQWIVVDQYDPLKATSIHNIEQDKPNFISVTAIVFQNDDIKVGLA